MRGISRSFALSLSFVGGVACSVPESEIAESNTAKTSKEASPEGTSVDSEATKSKPSGETKTANEDDVGDEEETSSSDSEASVSDEVSSEEESSETESSETESSEEESSETETSDSASDEESSGEETGEEETGSEETGDDDKPCIERLELITPEFLKEKLSMLSGELPAKIGGKDVMIPERSTAENRKNAREWLKEQYEAIGYETWTEEYGSNGVNFFAQRDGDSEEFLLIGAHLDSVNRAPGADDDGGGIIMGLAIATVIQECKLPYTVRFVGFDQEELGLLGSRAYAKKLQNSGEIEQFRGLLQLEMPGYDADGDGVYQLIDCEYDHSKHLREAVMAADSASLTKVKAEIRCESRSDHQSFWDIDQGAVMILERFFGPNADKNKCYHRPCDKVDIIDFEYMHGLTDVTARAALALLEIP